MSQSPQARNELITKADSHFLLNKAKKRRVFSIDLNSSRPLHPSDNTPRIKKLLSINTPTSAIPSTQGQTLVSSVKSSFSNFKDRPFPSSPRGSLPKIESNQRLPNTPPFIQGDKRRPHNRVLSQFKKEAGLDIPSLEPIDIKASPLTARLSIGKDLENSEVEYQLSVADRRRSIEPSFLAPTVAALQHLKDVKPKKDLGEKGFNFSKPRNSLVGYGGYTPDQALTDVKLLKGQKTPQGRIFT